MEQNNPNPGEYEQPEQTCQQPEQQPLQPEQQPLQAEQQPVNTPTLSAKARKILTASAGVLLAIITFAIGIAIGRGGRSSSSYSASASSSSGKSSSSSYSSSSYSSSNEMSHSTYCRLYVKISDVQVKHNHNYTYVTGKVTNTGTYSVKYVKVKAVAKDRTGTIVDTDWTYAVGSEWLDPGECKTFEMMIRDESGKITKADVAFME